MDVLLTDRQILDLAGPGSRILTYPDIKGFDNIESLFGNDKKLIILYLNDVQGNNYTGHWVCLLKRREGGKTVVEFDDPYSLPPDDELLWHSEAKRRSMGEDHNYLERLLHEFSEQPNCAVDYNEDRVQSKSSNVATCGRWTALRCHFSSVPLVEWQKFWRNVKKRGYNLDKVAVAITDMLNGSPITQE